MTDLTTTNQARASLYRKIAAVTAAVSRIPKNGENTYHHYRYVTESDITDGLRDVLKEHGLAFLPPSVISWERDEVIENPKLGPRTRVQVQFAVACCDTGEVFTSIIWGEGQDTSDKGFYKAYTGAVKYFLMKTFLIATGDDPEQDDGRQQEQRRPAPLPRQQARPTPQANGNGKGALIGRAIELFNIAREQGIKYRAPKMFKEMTEAELRSTIADMEQKIIETTPPPATDVPLFDDPELEAAVDEAIAKVGK